MSGETRNKGQTQAFYNRISKVYAYAFDRFEKGPVDDGLKLLDVREGERVLEVGFGTGLALEQIAKAVGEEGKVYGIDLSSSMVELARKRLRSSQLSRRAKLYHGDVLTMAFEDSKFDAEFISFTLELLEVTEMMAALKEIGRVLKPGGRLGMVSLLKDENSLPGRIYERIHKTVPRWVNCRPIDPEKWMQKAGFVVEKRKQTSICKLPVAILVGSRPHS